MKSVIPKKLLLKRETISIHKIYGAYNAGQSQPIDPSDQTLSSAFHDPTESQINPMLLSFDETICI